MHKKLLIHAGIAFLLVVSSIVFFLLAVYSTLPDVRALERWKPPQVSAVYDTKGRHYGDIGIQFRFYVPLKDIPEHVVQAFLSAEDRNFFNHHGVDVGAVIRAFFANLKAGRVVQGGSTITQQLARNLFLTRERTLKRKLREALLAIKIERTFSKEKILELYLNQIYLGSGAYGVEAASRIYFGKHVKELTLEEAALLAGLPKAPSRFNPFVNPELAKVRRNYVLKRMLEDGYITDEEYKLAVTKPIRVSRESRYRVSDYVLDMVRDYVLSRYGDLASQGGLSIYITIDKDLQEVATRALREGLERLAKIKGIPKLPDSEEDMKELYNSQNMKVFKEGRVYVGKIEELRDGYAVIKFGKRKMNIDLMGLNYSGRKYLFFRLEKGIPKLVPDLQGALVSLDVHTGAIRAIVGGYSYAYSSFNRATRAKRQPGSAIKPIIYLSALLRGETQISSIDASPKSYYDPSIQKEWTPKNYDEREYSVVTLREALAKSINTATVNLLDKLGFDIVLEVGRKAGLKDLKPYYSLALGTVEVTPLELTGAYQVFANLGVRCEPYLVEKVVDARGNVLEENAPSCEEVLPPQETRVLVDMLRAVILEGTGVSAKNIPRTIAGKTGTTDDYMDAWFVGFSPHIVAGVWVGYDTKVSIGSRMSGARAALPVWKNFMGIASLRYPDEDFPLPEGTIVVPINPQDYVRADETCPGVNMVFVEGTEPQLTCSDIRYLLGP